MKKILIATILSSIFSVQAFASTSTPDIFDFSKLSNEQKQQIGKIASEYIIQNPEVLIQASQTLQQKQELMREELQKQAIIGAVADSEIILNDPLTPFVGPKNAETAMVIFTDYNCIYCSKAAPDISDIIKQHPEMKFVFKELPVLSDRFPSSLYAAQIGHQVFKEKGSDAYLKYHEGLYKTGLSEGNMTKEIVNKMATDLGISPQILDEANSQIKKNEDIAKNLGITGTPGFVIMRNQKPTQETTAIIPGYIPKEQIEEIIKNVHQNK